MIVQQNYIVYLIGLFAFFIIYKWIFSVEEKLRIVVPDERSLHKYNISSYFLDWYHYTNCMEGSTTYTLPYWMGVYHGIIK